MLPDLCHNTGVVNDEAQTMDQAKLSVDLPWHTKDLPLFPAPWLSPYDFCRWVCHTELHDDIE
jgi:hypothetical protein